MTPPRRGAVLGVDVGYSEREETTGFCLIYWDDHSVNWNFENATKYDKNRPEALLRVLDNRKRVLAVAIDGPLRRDLRIEYSYRACEALLSRGDFNKRGRPGQCSSGSGKDLHNEATTLAKFILKR